MEEWDYCQIKFSTYHNVGGGEHGGLNYGLLWFEANAKGTNGRYEAGKSTEVPFGRAIDGYPNADNPSHVSAHRELVIVLKRNGWQQVSGGGSGWWENRFRRDPARAPRSLGQKIRGILARKIDGQSKETKISQLE